MEKMSPICFECESMRGDIYCPITIMKFSVSISQAHAHAHVLLIKYVSLHFQSHNIVIDQVCISSIHFQSHVLVIRYAAITSLSISPKIIVIRYYIIIIQFESVQFDIVAAR